jgi:hypothetical protein
MVGMTDKIIKKIKLNKSNLNYFDKLLDYFKIIMPIYYPIYAIFSAGIYLLANNNIISIIFSGIWLLLTIFSFQIALYFLITNLLIKKVKKNIISKIYLLSYAIFSVLFGWITANVAKEILNIPMIFDLTIAIFGTTILPYLYIRIIFKYLKI